MARRGRDPHLIRSEEARLSALLRRLADLDPRTATTAVNRALAVLSVGDGVDCNVTHFMRAVKLQAAERPQASAAAARNTPRAEAPVGRSDRLRDEILENCHRLDAHMHTIEQSFARIDQRLDTLERAIIPSAEPAQ